mgnify:CR=1 FL=1
MNHKRPLKYGKLVELAEKHSDIEYLNDEASQGEDGKGNLLPENDEDDNAEEVVNGTKIVILNSTASQSMPKPPSPSPSPITPPYSFPITSPIPSDTSLSHISPHRSPTKVLPKGASLLENYGRPDANLPGPSAVFSKGMCLFGIILDVLI